MSEEETDVKDSIQIDKDSNVIYVTEQASINWNTESADAFLKLYAESQDLFYSGALKTRRAVFDWISSELALKGFYYHWTQCENKWKSLKRSFTNRAQKNPGILEHPSPHDKLMLKIFKREKSSPIELHQLPNQQFREIKITRVKNSDEDSVDELVDALVNNDETYLETLNDCAAESDEGDDAEDGLEHTYSTNSQVSQKNVTILNTKDTPTRSQPPRGVKRPATELNLDVANELVGLRNDLSTHHRENKELLNYNVGVQEKLVKVLSKMEKQNEQALQQKTELIEKQSMIGQQLKIQNSLLAKLVHHLINKE